MNPVVFYRTAIIALLLLSTGCVSNAMRAVPPGHTVDTPESGKAVVVFFRPSLFGGAIQSSVFDLSTEDDRLVGIVSSKTKVAYQADPGEHLFMVIGENADFMKANLEAGKT